MRRTLRPRTGEMVIVGGDDSAVGVAQAQADAEKRAKALAKLKTRHAGVLALAAMTAAFPYDVPPWLPRVLLGLARHVNDPTPLDKSAKEALASFKKTHHDNWETHKQAFTSEELEDLGDALVSPSYFS